MDKFTLIINNKTLTTTIKNNIPTISIKKMHQHWNRLMEAWRVKKLTNESYS